MLSKLSTSIKLVSHLPFRAFATSVSQTGLSMKVLKTGFKNKSI